MTPSQPTDITSHLTILDINTLDTHRRLSRSARFEAPNWSRCGKFLVVNEAGLLFRFDLSDHTYHPIPTAFANSNNNDHGISPDGQQLVISHHSVQHDNASIIYTLPIEGGTPTQITALGPSYWHGWSPDGRFLAFVAGRQGKTRHFDIYNVDIETRHETALTEGDWLDDGPDYSADGQSIYFNSSRSGSMQIWKMAADGSNPTQVISSSGSDWFPHPSPDGRSIVFIRYLEDQGEAHPFGRDVQIIHLDLASGKERPLTDIFYGGQGSLNVPSWSPDSQKIAFVEYEC